MASIPPHILDLKYKSILSSEQSWANSVALAVIKARPFTVWEVMMPLLLVFNYARSKSDREIFSKNLLFTKELALKAALDMLKDDQSKEAAISSIEEKTHRLLSSVKNGIYSDTIRRKQIQEIDLLIDHYCKLLSVEGDKHKSLVVNAYQSLENYTAFLGQLKEIEKEVNSAALQTLGTRGNPETVSKIEEAANRVRMAIAQKIF